MKLLQAGRTQQHPAASPQPYPWATRKNQVRQRHTAQSHKVDAHTIRRALLATTLGTCLPTATTLRSAEATVVENVATDMRGDKVRNPSTSWGVLSTMREIRYPVSFAGQWQVRAKLASVRFPFGQGVLSREVPGVTKASMVAALPDVGAAQDQAVVYQCRFVDDGGAAVPDRQLNQQQLLDAFLGYAATQSVDYDHVKNPSRWAVVYKTPRKDQSEQSADVRKAEVFVNACRSASESDGFWTAESMRQVNQAKQSGFTYDYEILHHYTGIGGDEMQDELRVAAFLVPQAPQFWQTQGQAVALYDYKLSLTRAPPT